jgi:hypothetical protein
VTKIETALKPMKDISYDGLKTVLNSIVRSYGGDPLDMRQRLDDLLKKEAKP